MNAPTIARDANGNVALTTEQARDLAWWWTVTGLADEPAWLIDDEGYESDLAIREDDALAALAAWVLRWAPAVMAAERQADVADEWAALCDRGSRSTRDEIDEMDDRDEAARSSVIQAVRAARDGAS